MNLRPFLGGLLVTALFACSSLPDPKYKKYAFPEKDVFVEAKPTRRYQAVGSVRVRVNFNSLNPEREDQDLCRNYFNKGAGDLLKRAKRDRKGDAVMDVRSVVYYMDGKTKKFPKPECADDGGEGQVLMEGMAIRYIPDPVPSPSSTPSLVPSPAPSP